MATGSRHSARWQHSASDTWAWIQRHPAVADLLIPLAVAALTVSPAGTGHVTRSPWVWLGTVGCLLPLAWRRSHPVTVFAVVMTAGLLAAATDTRQLGLAAAVALLTALYTVAARMPLRYALTAAGGFEAWAVLALVRWAPAGAAAAATLLMTGTAAAAVMTGVYLQTRRAYLASLEDRAARLEAERDQQAQLAVAIERARIAREMHDIITHSLSVMVALSDGAGAAAGASPQRASEVMRQVADTGRQALSEMRRMLGTLRTEDTDADRHPQPGVAQLDDLLIQVRSAGLPARLIIEGTPHPVAPGTQLAIYRIVQESLTNIRKHAPTATGATIRLRYQADGVDVDVTDNGRATGRQPATAGQGILGMRERAAAYGGAIDAGPDDNGGWRVHAHLRRETEEPW